MAPKTENVPSPEKIVLVSSLGCSDVFEIHDENDVIEPSILVFAENPKTGIEVHYSYAYNLENRSPELISLMRMVHGEVTRLWPESFAIHQNVLCE